jgi:hypothetical protein
MGLTSLSEQMLYSEELKGRNVADKIQHRFQFPFSFIPLLMILYSIWFEDCVALGKEIHHMIASQTYGFSSEYLRHAGNHINRKIVIEQSPHPYPNGGKIFFLSPPTPPNKI